MSVRTVPVHPSLRRTVACCYCCCPPCTAVFMCLQKGMLESEMQHHSWVCVAVMGFSFLGTVGVVTESLVPYVLGTASCCRAAFLAKVRSPHKSSNFGNYKKKCDKQLFSQTRSALLTGVFLSLSPGGVQLASTFFPVSPSLRLWTPRLRPGSRAGPKKYRRNAPKIFGKAAVKNEQKWHIGGFCLLILKTEAVPQRTSFLNGWGPPSQDIWLCPFPSACKR